MIALVFLATIINYLDRQTLSVAAPVLREQFHMSNVEYSRVVFAFMLAYTIMNGVSGPLVDRLGTRLGYALCMAWWSIAARSTRFLSSLNCRARTSVWSRRRCTRRSFRSRLDAFCSVVK